MKLKVLFFYNKLLCADTFGIPGLTGRRANQATDPASACWRFIQQHSFREIVQLSSQFHVKSQVSFMLMPFEVTVKNVKRKITRVNAMFKKGRITINTLSRSRGKTCLLYLFSTKFGATQRRTDVNRFGLQFRKSSTPHEPTETARS